MVEAQDGEGGVDPSRLPADGTIVGIAGPEGSRPWRTRLEWTDAQTMCVVAPLRPAEAPWDVGPGDRLRILWSTELGLIEASGSLRSAERDVVDLWVIDLECITRHQRRDAFRLPLMAPIELQWQQRWTAGQMRDISETGLRCRVSDRTAPAVEDAVTMTLAIAGEAPLVLAGEVSRSQPVQRTIADRRSPAPPVSEVDLGIVFVDLDLEVADRVRRFVFEQQLRRRAGN